MRHVLNSKTANTGKNFTFTLMDNEVLLSAIKTMTELPGEEYGIFNELVYRHELRKGEHILNEGQICRAIYFVEKGYLRTYYNKEDGATINLNFTFEQEFTSNLKSAINREPSKMVIEAGEDTTLWCVDLNKLTPEIKARPTVGRFMRRITMQMLLASESRGNLLKIYSPAERYHYIEEQRPQILQRVPLVQLASFLGVSRETLSRIRAKKV
jgi:CRP-like cAMP-binding protein